MLRTKLTKPPRLLRSLNSQTSYSQIKMNVLQARQKRKFEQYLYDIPGHTPGYNVGCRESGYIRTPLPPQQSKYQSPYKSSNQRRALSYGQSTQLSQAQPPTLYDKTDAFPTRVKKDTIFAKSFQCPAPYISPYGSPSQKMASLRRFATMALPEWMMDVCGLQAAVMDIELLQQYGVRSLVGVTSNNIELVDWNALEEMEFSLPTECKCYSKLYYDPQPSDPFGIALS